MAQRKRRSQARKPQRQTPGWVLAGGGVLAGLAIATLLFIGGVIDAEAPLEGVAGSAPESQERQIREEPATADETEFTFYEQLQKAEPTAPRNDPMPERSDDGREYLVQAGSFRQFNEAESVKAQLAFLGLTARVEAVDVNGVRWHRVVLGPFESRRNADQVQRQLRENQFDAQLRSQARG